MNKEVLKKAIGIKIKQMRTIKGWSREHMADKLKMSVSNYGNIERGETNLTKLQIRKI
jgi:transcriptional regulator with XRE-family HTH domain